MPASELARAVGEQTLDAFAKGSTAGKKTERSRSTCSNNPPIALVQRHPLPLRRNVSRLWDWQTLGGSLSCERDYALIQGFNPDIELDAHSDDHGRRLMHCDFRFRFASCEGGTCEPLAARLASRLRSCTIPHDSRHVTAAAGSSSRCCRSRLRRRLLMIRTGTAAQNLRPEMFLLLGKHRDRLPGDLDVLLVSPRALSERALHSHRRRLAKPDPAARSVSPRYSADDRPAEQRRDSLPLKVDLAQPLALLGRQMLAHPFALCFVNRPACRDHARASLALQTERLVVELCGKPS